MSFAFSSVTLSSQISDCPDHVAIGPESIGSIFAHSILFINMILPARLPPANGKLPLYPDMAREQSAIRRIIWLSNKRRGKMPVLLLWAVPAVIIIGGTGYWLVHLH
jgi:hypothetical protein